MTRHSTLLKIFLALLAFLPAAASGEDIAEVKYSGDVYRISTEAAPKVILALEESGGECYYHRGDLYLLMYPEDFDIYSVIAECEESVNPQMRVASAQGRRKNEDIRRKVEVIRRVGGLPGNTKIRPAVENGRHVFGADRILEGEGLPGAFDGSNVTVGFCDVGFDANHPNFLSSDGSSSRVKLFVNYNLEKGVRQVFDTPEEIRNFATDTPDNYHATHVAGILAGRGTTSGTHISLAPGADIVATTSTLHDVEILAGVEDIIAYAKNAERPAVINLSLGSYGDPHDGTSLVCQYLDRCAEDAIICLSTGNEGKGFNHISYRFQEEGEELLFRPSDRTWDYLEIAGSTDIYADDSTPLRLCVRIQDSVLSGLPVVYSTPIIDFEDEPLWILTSNPELESLDPAVHYDKEFACYFDGIIILTGEEDPYNGRYHVRMEWMATTDIIVSETKKWGRYQLAGALYAPAGTSVELYADGILSAFQTAGVKVKPDSSNSFSDLCTGYKTVSVGAYSVAESIGTMGNLEYIGGTPMEVCGFSSYGTTPDGRVMPLVIAPGAPIVSSFSSPYVEENGVDFCVFTDDGAYWGVENGTSMSTPYVAGGIAVWLQANPELTVGDVQRILAATNRTDSFDNIQDPRNGYGAFDPFAGLKMVLDGTLTDVTTIFGKALFAEYLGSNGSGRLRIFNPESRNVRIEVVATDGTILASGEVGNEELIEVGHNELNPHSYKGVAICRVSAPGTAADVVKILL